MRLCEGRKNNEIREKNISVGGENVVECIILNKDYAWQSTTKKKKLISLVTHWTWKHRKKREQILRKEDENFKEKFFPDMF